MCQLQCYNDTCLILHNQEKGAIMQNKKVLIIIGVLVLLVGSVFAYKTFVASDTFDFEQSMTESVKKMNAAKQMESSIGVEISGKDSELLSVLESTEESTAEDIEQMKQIFSVLDQVVLTADMKMDLESLKMDVNYDIDYKAEDFISVGIYIDEEEMAINSEDLLTKGVILEFDFLQEMLEQQGQSDVKFDEFSSMLKNQIASGQEFNNKMTPIVMSMFMEDLGQPEVTDESISLADKEMKVKKASYTVNYTKALELTKKLLDNDEFRTMYIDYMKKQFDNMTSMGTFSEEDIDEMIAEYEKSFDEMSLLIEEVLVDDKKVEKLDQMTFTLAYYFDKDELKKVEYDLGFAKAYVDYISINESLNITSPSEDDHIVVDDQSKLMQLMGVVDQQKVMELQNHELIQKLMELQR